MDIDLSILNIKGKNESAEFHFKGFERQKSVLYIGYYSVIRISSGK